jgi:hypothetical protein
VRAIAIATLFALSAGLGPAAIALAPKAAGPVAIVAAPWAAAGEAARIVAAADGSLVAATGDATSPSRAPPADDFVARLYRAGALIVSRCGACGRLPARQPHPYRAPT